MLYSHILWPVSLPLIKTASDRDQHVFPIISPYQTEAVFEMPKLHFTVLEFIHDNQPFVKILKAILNATPNINTEWFQFLERCAAVFLSQVKILDHNAKSCTRNNLIVP